MSENHIETALRSPLSPAKKPLTKAQDQRRHLLALLIQKSGLTQSQLAPSLKLKTPSTIRNWLSGERPIPYERILQFSSFFGIAPILWLEDDPFPEREFFANELAGRLIE